MTFIIIIIGLLNIIDLSLTLEWITKYPEMEANPIMLQLWLYSPGIFTFIKLISTTLFCFIAYRFKNNSLLRYLIWIPLFIYVFVAVLNIIVLKIVRTGKIIA